MIRLLPITLLLEICSIKISVSNLFTTGIEICDPKDCETKNPPGKRSRGCMAAPLQSLALVMLVKQKKTRTLGAMKAWLW